MTDALLLATGAVLVLVVCFDALATTLTVSGAGPLTRRVLPGLWQVVLRCHRPDSASRVLTGAGPALLFLTVAVWVVGLWVGWWLVFLGSDTIVDASTSLPAEAADVFYYAGFTVFTLGVGDYVASDPAGRILTALASFGGLFLITLAITYLLSVVGAAVARRAVAVRINALGSGPGDIVARGWTGDSFSSAFVQQLVALTGQLALTAEQHLAYPVLHYFRSADVTTAAPVAVARLDEAMLLLQAGVAEAARPDESAVEPVRRAIGRYLHTASSTSSGAAQPPTPPVPDPAPLRAAGIPVAPVDHLVSRAGHEADRRRTLHQLVRSNGWSWPAPPTGGRG